MLGLSLVIALLTPEVRGQRKKDSRDEVFETVDPYTGGTREGLDRAGYVSLGPFPWCEGVRTVDIEEAVGRSVLWVETAHFKIGSTLETYRTKGDKKEDKRLLLELERLTPKLGATKLPTTKLDPWLRLHLYAQRLEDAYASFLATFSIDEADFKKPIDRWNPMGDGPYLGQPLKFTVLLFEKQASQGRYMSRYLQREAQTSVRERLAGGSLLLITNAEVLRGYGFELDAALHCAVVADTTLNMVDGFRNSWSAPFWFKQGLAHTASRLIDERWTVFAAGTMGDKTDSWKWEPRVFGLVTNSYAPSWKTMCGWARWEDLDAVGHMVSWSRVTWLLSRKDADLKGFLMDLTQPLPVNSSADRDSIVLQRQEPALKKAFGKDGAELDAAWREYVTRTYKK
jgi:hypothetical protein